MLSFFFLRPVFDVTLEQLILEVLLVQRRVDNIPQGKHAYDFACVNDRHVADTVLRHIGHDVFQGSVDGCRKDIGIHDVANSDRLPVPGMFGEITQQIALGNDAGKSAVFLENQERTNG